MDNSIREADMHAPVRDCFNGLGYKVRGEVAKCDLAAERDGELAVVEFKKNFTLRLIYQTLERLALTDQVYVAIPRPKIVASSEYRGMLRLLKKLELGLLTVAMDSPVKTVDALLYPEPHCSRRNNTKRRKSLLKELYGRLMDLNSGGSVKGRIFTAYRECCIKAACIIKCTGPKRPKDLVGDYGFEKNVALILQKNFDGWFERLEPGLYGLSGAGERFLSEQNPLAEYYVREFKSHLTQ